MNAKRERIKYFKNIMGKLQKKVRNIEYKCMHPDCHKTAIWGHSQSRTHLNRIAENGCVYAQDRNYYHVVLRGLNPEDGVIISKTTVAEASLYKGFCAHHDTTLFRSIDTAPLRKGDLNQVAALELRAFTFEIFQKIKTERLMRLFLDATVKDNFDWDPSLQLQLDSFDLFLKRDAPLLLDMAFDCFTNKGINIQYIWIEIPKVLPVSCTSQINPLFEHYYQHKSFLGPGPQPTVAFSIVPSNDCTNIVLSWHDYCNNEANWLKQYAETNTEKMINHFALCQSEDTCIKPSFWESLSDDMVSQVRKAMRHELYRGTLKSIPLAISL